MSSTFATDVAKGLSEEKKTLSSKYFYDKIGDELFIKIMHSNEYYLTNSELDIFKNQSQGLIEGFSLKNGDTDLIELGAGDGSKTTHLLKEMLNQNIDFTYAPIDISEHAVNSLVASLKTNLPTLKLRPRIGDYFNILEEENTNNPKNRIILFLGSNLGNLNNNQASQFLTKLSSRMQTGDKLLLGLDIKKLPSIILAAYNDKGGHTRDFNLNLLTRINNELGANFNLNNFIHAPYYDPILGRSVSSLVSTKEQVVFIKELNQEFTFRAWEAIQTEISQKYDLHSLNEIIKGTGLVFKRVFYDQNKLFMDVLIEKES